MSLMSLSLVWVSLLTGHTHTMGDWPGLAGLVSSGQAWLQSPAAASGRSGLRQQQPVSSCQAQPGVLGPGQAEPQPVDTVAPALSQPQPPCTDMPQLSENDQKYLPRNLGNVKIKIDRLRAMPLILVAISVHWLMISKSQEKVLILSSARGVQ